MGESLWIGMMATTMMMVEQLGLAMIPRCFRIISELTSGPTNGTSGSIGNAEELSTTTAPSFAATGAISLEMLAPAEKSAKSIPRKELFVKARTSMGCPWKDTVFPADLSEASGTTSETGK